MLAKNTETYISFSVGCLRFLDTLRFLQCSLDASVSSMTSDQFKYSSEDLRKKLAYPYEYCKTIDDYNKVIYDDDDDKVLLAKEHYYSHLTNDYPKDEYIERTTNLIKKYKITNNGTLNRILFEE